MVSEARKRGRPVINGSRDDRLVEMYRNGVPIADLARDFGVSRQRVWVILRNRGISGPESHVSLEKLAKKWLTKSRKKEIKNLLGPIPSCYDLTLKYRISRDLAGVVRSLLLDEFEKLENEKNHVKMEARKKDIELARRMRALGATWKFLSDYFGICYSKLFKEVEVDPFWKVDTED